MVEVELVFEGETDVWMSEEVFDAIKRHDDPMGDVDLRAPGAGLLRKIRYWSTAGFASFQGGGGSGRPIKHEGQGVYRLGYRDLFRVYGFYDGAGCICFVAVAAHSKKQGTKNTRRERQVIDKVARLKRDGNWTRKK